MDRLAVPVVITCYEPNRWLLPYCLAAVWRHLRPLQIITVPMPTGAAWADGLRDVIRGLPWWFLLLLEDYVLCEADIGTINMALPALSIKHHCIRLSPCPRGTGAVVSRGWTKGERDAQYAVSLQPSVWYRSALHDLLQPGWTAFDVELKGSPMRNGKHDRCPTVISDTTLISYHNVLRRGIKQDADWAAAKQEYDEHEVSPEM